MLIFFDADDFPPQISCEQHTDRPTDRWDRNITSFCRDKKRTRSWSSFHQTDCEVNRDCVPLAGNTNMVGYLKNDETIQHIHTVSVRLPSAGIWLDLATNNILLPPSRPLCECVCERVCVCVCVCVCVRLNKALVPCAFVRSSACCMHVRICAHDFSFGTRHTQRRGGGEKDRERGREPHWTSVQHSPT